MMDFLRGLFGASARQAMPSPMTPPIVAQPPGGYTGMGPEADGQVIRRPPPVSMAQMASAPAEPSRRERFAAMLQDAGAALQGGQGDAQARVREEYRARQAKAEKETLLKRLETMATELYPDDEEARLLFRMNPEAFVEQRLKAREPQKPIYVEGPDGIYERVGDKWVRAADYPNKPQPTPLGMVRNPETGALEWEPGYVEAQGQLTGMRRDAVVSRPMPSRARADGARPVTTGGSSIPPPPRGYSIVRP